MGYKKSQTIWQSGRYRIRKCQRRGYRAYYELQTQFCFIWWLTSWSVSLSLMQEAANRRVAYDTEFDKWKSSAKAKP